MIRIVVHVGAGWEVQQNHVVGSEILHTMPDAWRNYQQGWPEIARMVLLEGPVCRTGLATVVEDDLQVSLTDEQSVDRDSVAASGAKCAGKQSGLVEMYNRHSGGIPLGSENLGDHAMIPRHMRDLFGVNPLDVLLQLFPVRRNQLRVFLRCVEHARYPRGLWCYLEPLASLGAVDPALFSR